MAHSWWVGVLPGLNFSRRCCAATFGDRSRLPNWVCSQHLGTRLAREAAWSHDKKNALLGQTNFCFFIKA
jgi:hypothetical protein